MLKSTIEAFLWYLIFLVPSLIVGMLVWTIFVDGKLYYCSDKVPVLDFIPPFVHGLQYGDYWVVDPKLVWIVWFLLIGLMLIAPYFPAKDIIKERNCLSVFKKT